MKGLDGVKKAKYIKLGAKGGWERLCIEDGTLRIDYREADHKACLTGDMSAVADIYTEGGAKQQAATSHARQILNFYETSRETVWITFHGGFMWWCVADGDVQWLGGNSEEIDAFGSRCRNTLDGWHNQTLSGEPLYENELNGALTKVKAYRGTICDVKEFDYLIRKLKGEDLPQVCIAKEIRQEMLASAVDLMKMLTPQDFELLVDLVFSGSGWRRMNLTGGTTKTTDLELVLPTTGERAFVQVKSSTTQQQLDDYLAQLEDRHETRMFYVYHTSNANLKCDWGNVHLMDGRAFAEMVLNAGLFDWLLKKAG